METAAAADQALQKPTRRRDRSTFTSARR